MRPVSRVLLLICALLAVVPATASAAGAPAAPKVTKVTPLKLRVGERLTVRGSGFLKGKNRNTVVFKRDGARAIFAKAESATTTVLVVRVPAKLGSFLALRAGRPVATRFRLRVLARRLSKSYTPASGSPRISPSTSTSGSTAAKGSSAGSGTVAKKASASTAAPAAPAPDCDADGTPDATDTDDDNDLLPDTTEAGIGTDRCAADHDRDGIEDGWEYKSAYDLNQRSCPVVGDYPVPCAAAIPYPGKRPYPNPLDASDAGQDYDGDSLTALEEFAAWWAKGRADASRRTLINMWYSDGLQASQDTSAASGCRGMTVPEVFNGVGARAEFEQGTAPASYPDVTSPLYDVYTLDNVGTHGGDGCLDDAERDEDGDFLNNFTEAHGPMSGPKWWAAVKPFDVEPAFRIAYAGTNWLTADTDGDGVVDGLDDQDHDDFLNVEEAAHSDIRGSMSRTADNQDVPTRTGLWLQPYNPCLPAIRSRTCPTTIPAGVAPWRPWATDDGDPTPRWPLYRDYLYDPRDVDPSAPDPATAPDLSPPELWDPPAGYSQTLPALHPLPRQ